MKMEQNLREAGLMQYVIARLQWWQGAASDALDLEQFDVYEIAVTMCKSIVEIINLEIPDFIMSEEIEVVNRTSIVFDQLLSTQARIALAKIAEIKDKKVHQ